jgi:hypothetical protein
VWIGPARRSFVPQGLVVDGSTAYVSGYRAGRVGHRWCAVVVADARSGRTRAFQRGLEGTFQGQPVVCRHGGGLAMGPDGLWLAETGRLWLLDPEALRAGTDPVRRVWVIEAPVRGSALASRGGRLALLGWSAQRRQRVFWVPVSELLVDGITQVGADPGPGTAMAAAGRRLPSRVQGAAWGRGGLWVARSTTYCGELLTPGGRTAPFFPGAEGMSFARGRLWVVSESGSRTYQRQGGRPEVPTLIAIDPDQLLPEAAPSGPDAGCWD